MHRVIVLTKFKIIKLIKNSIFNKITLVYSIIIISTISILVSFIIYSLSNMLREQALDYTDQVIKTVTNYFYNQCLNYKKTEENIYTFDGSSSLSNYIIPLLENKSRNTSTSTITQYNIINNYFLSAVMPRDDDVEDIFLINKSMNWNMRFSRTDTYKNILTRCDIIQNYLMKTDNFEFPSVGKRIKIIPAINFNGKYYYSIYDYVRYPDAKNYAGYLVYTYNTEAIRNSYSLFNEYLLGTILIIRSDGNVIFDSSNVRHNIKFSYEKMVNNISGTYEDNGYIIKYTKDNTFDFITVGIVPENSIYKEVNILNSRIILITIFCIISVILLTSLIAKLFTKRINIIVQTIQKIQKGDFSARAAVGNTGDEVQLIANNLNIMSCRIDNYIKKEYIYELKQKDAMLKEKNDQLYALQMQINPHFLYNTLEVIRMTALISHDEKTEKMIKLLAKVLHGTIKGGMFHTVQEELQICESYLDLVKIRFGNRLKVSYHIDPNILPYIIPKNIMQPIIENSIIHGGKTNVISIKGALISNKVVIIVSDNGKGIPGSALRLINAQLEKPYNFKDNRIGIYNVNSRIKLLFGDKYGLHLNSILGKGTQVIVTFEAKRTEDVSK